MKSICTNLVAVATLFALQASGQAFAKQLPPTSVDTTPFIIAANSAFYACAFDLQVQYNGKGGSLALPGGRFTSVAISPGFTATLTNVQKQENSLTVSLTGTIRTSVDSYGITTYMATGRNLLGDPTTGLVVAIGDFSFAFDSSGRLVKTLSGTGRLLPVCPMVE